MEGNLLELAGAYGVLAGYYDELMDEIDYDLWCDYVLGLVACGDTAEGSKSGAEVVGGSAPGGLVAAKPKGYGKIGPRVLDLACGTGQFAYRLGQRGFVVTAVDISSEMLAVAEAKARSLNLEISFFRQDMRQLQLPKCYDLVVCLCDSLNYLLEVDDLTATFSGVARVLEPGGHFVFDLNTEHKLATVYGDNTYAADLGDYAYIWENEYQPDTKLCYMDLAFFVPTLALGKWGRESETPLFERLTESHVQRSFPPERIANLVEAAGLKLLGQYGDLTLASPNPTTERITFHCYKPSCL